MWRELGVFGNRVFRNAAPYLRIRASAKGEWSGQQQEQQGQRHGSSCSSSSSGGSSGSRLSIAHPSQLRAQPLAHLPANLELDPLDDTRN